VSEVMLQQTQAARVVPAFEGFVARFPDVQALARASRAEVLRAWGTLGYNRRAIALHDAARTMVERHGGRVPREIDQLRALPGIGPYTASAIASIAFDEPVPALDVNVTRVVARTRIGTDHAGPAEVSLAANAWIDRTDPGGWNQALMDVGREMCRPRPRCDACPLRRGCRFRARDSDPAPARRRQSPYAGSNREARGAVIRTLRETSGITTIASIVRRTGVAAERVVPAVRALADEGSVRAGAAALAGSGRGRVRLPI
jgi:A/G-specific adenine glycosylase